jgi:DNA-directed RNA polymerase subunit E'/Rpb7|tara:strand:+ start:2397 stop:3128 length:732 start_codon:yes stop_codon:yes gene_type:complete
MDIFFETVLEDIIKIRPSDCTKDFKANIHRVLVSKYEGVCSKFGYISEKTIELVTVYLGKIELQTFHGYVKFNVKFKASICNPAVDSVVKCTVINLNSFGILSHVISDRTNKPIMNIIIPKQSNSIVNNSSVDNISIGDTIFVEIVGKKYQLHSTSISAVGKVIDHSDARIKLEDYTTKLDMEEDDVDDAEIMSVVGDDENKNETSDEESEQEETTVLDNNSENGYESDQVSDNDESGTEEEY